MFNLTGGASRAWTLAALAITGDALAQQPMQIRPVPGPVKDAGTYHMATGTWTRGSQHENLGAKVLYSNLANTGSFGIMGSSADLHWTDEGRVPSTGGHANAKSDAYTVQSIQIAYCSSVLGQPQTGGLDFFNSYASCTNPTGATVLSVGISVPGAQTTTSCWIVTFDLKGTSFEFGLDGDADGTFDGTTALDNFGWTIHLDDLGAGGFNGPLLNGDPNNFPYGDGTYYQSPGATLTTGLGTQDQFWLRDTSGSIANGCYWFLGYPAGNPFASFWLQLGGDNGGGELGTKYCATNANSTGAPADISAFGGTAHGGDITLTSVPVPNQPSIFFHGPNAANVPFGNGVRCAGGNLVRGAVTVGAGNSATYTYDNSDTQHTLLAFMGQLRHFQHWFRDPMGGGAFFNLSNGVQFVVPSSGGGGDPQIDSFDPPQAGTNDLVTLQGSGFGTDEDDISVQVIELGPFTAMGDIAFSRATLNLSSMMKFRLDGIPTTMTAGTIRVQVGDGVSGTLNNLPPGILLQGQAWSWLDSANDGARAESEAKLLLANGDPIPCAGGSLYYGKVEADNRLRITIPAGNPLPAGATLRVVAGAVTSANEWALECNVLVKTVPARNTCEIGTVTCEILQQVFFQQHGQFLNCTTEVSGGNCATNPTVTVVASGPGGLDLGGGRGAIIVCPP